MKKGKLLYMIAICALVFLISGVRAEAAGTPEKQVTAVEVPQNLNFYLDPENKKGNGQIYSSKYEVRNAGKETVTFSMEMALSVLEEEAAIALCPEAWTEEPSGRSVYMYVIFEGSQGVEQYTLTDTEDSCKESIVLQPAGMDGDSFSIRFGGMLSSLEEWKSGELGIHSIYAMTAGSIEYPPEITGKHIQIGKVKQIGENGMELFIVPDEGFSLPAEVRIIQEDSEIEAAYDAVTGKIVLENVTGSVMIYASGITNAVLPDAEMINEEKAIWSWKAEEGIQAYEYTFLQEDEAVKKGRVNVKRGAVNWNWSEELADGSYQLQLKAIGDAIHCLNSEEADYSVTVNRELLQASESAEGEDVLSSEEQKNDDESLPPGNEDISLSEEQKNDDALLENEDMSSSEEQKNDDESSPLEE